MAKLRSVAAVIAALAASPANPAQAQPAEAFYKGKTVTLLIGSGVAGSSGSGGNTHLYPTFFANLLGMKIRVIAGYQGTSDILLAIERGEVMGMCSAHDPLSRQSLYRAGKLRILFQAAVTPSKAIE